MIPLNSRLECRAQTLQNDLMGFLSSRLVPGMVGQILRPEKPQRVGREIPLKGDGFLYFGALKKNVLPKWVWPTWGQRSLGIEGFMKESLWRSRFCSCFPLRAEVMLLYKAFTWQTSSSWNWEQENGLVYLETFFTWSGQIGFRVNFKLTFPWTESSI